MLRISDGIFHSHGLGGFAKTLWVIAVIVLPQFGVLTYLIAGGSGMSRHALKQQDNCRRHILKASNQWAGGDTSTADQIASTLARLHSGAPTKAEFGSL